METIRVVGGAADALDAPAAFGLSESKPCAAFVARWTRGPHQTRLRVLPLAREQRLCHHLAFRDRRRRAVLASPFLCGGPKSVRSLDSGRRPSDGRDRRAIPPSVMRVW